MRKYFLFLAVVMMAGICRAGEPTAEALTWYESGSWRNGFSVNPFPETDIQLFYEQYHLAPEMWDSVFSWLASIEPTQMELSKKAMIWSHAYAKVLDQDLRTPENCQWEQHRRTIDLQWDATGSERYKLTRHPELLEAKNEYNEKKDVQNFRLSGAAKKDDYIIMDSSPSTFYLFFPSDYHEACGIADTPCTPRKIVVKIDLLTDTTALAAAKQVSDSVAFAQADFHWRSLGKGAEVGVAELQLFGRPEVVSVIRYPMHRWHTSFVHAPEAQSSTTDSLAIRAKAAFAINGSYFNMREFTPVTFFSCNHRIVGRQHPSTIKRSNGVVAVRGKKVSIFPYDSTQIDYVAKHYTSAIQCGPLLMVDGVALPFDTISFNTVNHPRSFIGTTPNGDCYMVVVDGRLAGNAEGATMWELLAIARWLGCTSALNLDGGGSSSLWTAAEGTINYPCDNHTFDHHGLRRIPNVIVVR